MSRSEVTLQFGVLGFASLNAVDFDLDDLVNICLLYTSDAADE